MFFHIIQSKYYVAGFGSVCCCSMKDHQAFFADRFIDNRTGVYIIANLRSRVGKRVLVGPKIWLFKYSKEDMFLGAPNIKLDINGYLLWGSKIE